MFYFLLAIFITCWDLFYIKMWLISRGQPYVASIGDWGSSFRNALFLAFDSYFMVSTMNLSNLFVSIIINNKQPCIIALFFQLTKRISCITSTRFCRINSNRYQMIKMTLVTHHMPKCFHLESYI